MAQPRPDWRLRYELKRRQKAQREWEREKNLVQRMASYRPEYRPQERAGLEQLTRSYSGSALFEQDRNRLTYFGGWRVQSISPGPRSQVWVVYWRGSQQQVQYHVHAAARPQLTTCRYCAHRVTPGSHCTNCGAPL
jgi:hypothetical protein